MAFECIGFFLNNNMFLSASFFTVTAGLVAGILAISTGLFEYARLGKYKALFRRATIHALIQILSWLLFATVIFLKYANSAISNSTSWLNISLMAIGFFSMSVGNYIGGDLVLSEGLGTRFFKQIQK
jgi:uncharacterized membrane protein